MSQPQNNTLQEIELVLDSIISKIEKLEKIKRGSPKKESKKALPEIVSDLVKMRSGVDIIDQWIKAVGPHANNVSQCESNDDGGYEDMVLEMEKLLGILNQIKGAVHIMNALLDRGIDSCKILSLDPKKEDDDEDKDLGAITAKLEATQM